MAKAAAILLKESEESPGGSRVKKVDDELQIVWAEVYVPGVVDVDGDFMSEESIRTMAYNFIESKKVDHIDVMHDNNLYGCSAVETFIARKGDPDFIEGSWVLGVHIPHSVIWNMVKKGELNGFSFQARAKRKPTDMEVDLPAVVKGDTSETEGHTHKFEAQYDEEGAFVGGKTDNIDGHSHLIVRGTRTEPPLGDIDGHTHRFCAVDGLVT